MKKDVAISVHNVRKDFHLEGHRPDSLKEVITQVFKKKDKAQHTHHALRGLTFDIKKGEFYGILGRNGSGKSTLLKIMAQIYQPTSGHVQVQGKLVPFIELGVGFNNNLTGRENVFLNGALLGFSRKEMKQRYDEIVAFAELEEFMDQKLKNYSSGMRVRLAFSVAIQADADILLLDEVLAVGDADFKKKCYNYFDTLKKNKKTIILVSHGMSVIREYCDKAILIEDGKISKQGTADEVADEYTRLFNKPSDTKGTARGAKRWGTQDVYMDTFELKADEKELKIITTLVAKDQPVDNIKFGFAIKNSQGKTIAGANNLNVEGAQELSFAAKEKKVLEFVMPNIYGSKTYHIGATLISYNNAVTYDKWDDIATFSNTKEQAFYPVVSPAKLTIR